jgi:hypothetical protein
VDFLTICGLTEIPVRGVLDTRLLSLLKSLENKLNTFQVGTSFDAALFAEAAVLKVDLLCGAFVKFAYYMCETGADPLADNMAFVEDKISMQKGKGWEKSRGLYI